MDHLVPTGDSPRRSPIRDLPKGEGGVMSSTHGYDREGFLTEFFPEVDDRVEVEAGAQALIKRTGHPQSGLVEPATAASAIRPRTTSRESWTRRASVGRRGGEVSGRARPGVTG